MPATLNDVAHAAGISNVTASRVLTSKQSAVPISEATRRRVLDAAARLSYRPNLLARGSRTQRSGAVAVLVEDIADPVFAALIPEVDTVLKERGDHLLLSHAALDSHSARTYDRPSPRSRAPRRRCCLTASPQTPRHDRETRRTVPVRCSCPSWSSGAPRGRCAPL